MTQRGAETRARLIQAAIDIVREVGYAKTTTRAIVRAANVSEGTLYRHFPDKRQLFLTAVLERNHELVASTAQLPAQAGTATVRENLAAALVRLMELRDELLPLELALMSDTELGSTFSNAGEALGRIPQGPPQYLAAYIRLEQNLGRVQAGIDPDQAAVVLLAMLIGLALAPVHGTRRGQTDLIDAAVDMFVSGIETRNAITSSG